MNDFLFRIGLLPTNLCAFCKEVSETTIHLFWSCDYSQIFWKEVLAWMKDTLLLPKETVLSCSMCLGLVVNETYDLLIEHLFLVIRYHIYASKRKNIIPKLQTFIELTIAYIYCSKCSVRGEIPYKLSHFSNAIFNHIQILCLGFL